MVPFVVPFVVPFAFGAEGDVHPLRGPAAVLVEDVRVGVERDPHVGVPEHLHELTGREPLRVEKRGGSMPELLDAAGRQSLTAQHALEPAQHVAPVERAPELRGEDEVELVGPTRPGPQPLLRLPDTVAPQGCGGEVGQGDSTPTGTALRLRQLECASPERELMPNRHHAESEVDVLPAQTERLALAQADAEHEHDVGSDPLAMHRGKESPRLGLAERTDLRNLRHGRSG